MMKIVTTAAVAALLCMSEPTAQCIVQKSEWQTKSFEMYLPPPADSWRWLDIDVRTKPRAGSAAQLARECPAAIRVAFHADGDTFGNAH